ncbi:MAG: hypothetical protein KBG22_12550, partial [Smithella sp.]|nr:hypothetical protein [Smithella sp.]
KVGRRIQYLIQAHQQIFASRQGRDAFLELSQVLIVAPVFDIEIDELTWFCKVSNLFQDFSHSLEVTTLILTSQLCVIPMSASEEES